MIRRTLLASSLTLALFALGSCGAARPSMFYQLNVPESSAPSAAPRFQTDLLVGRILAPQLYRDDRIVYRMGSTQLGAYEFHRWAEPPAETIESLLLRALRSSGNFRSAQGLRSNARGDYILRGRLHELNEIGSGSASVAARIDFEVELYSQKSGTVVWSRHYHNDETVNGKEVPAVVDAFNKNLQRAMDQIVAGLADYFAKNPPQQ